MYCKFDQLSFVSMSKMGFLLMENAPKTMEFDVFPEGNGVGVSQHEEENGASNDNAVKVEENCGTDKKGEDILFLAKEQMVPSLGDLEVDENDDGFRTPTSLEHKIPVIQQCPPAPKKQKPLPSAKRKSPSSSLRRVLIDFSDELEMFVPIPNDFLGDLHRKIKKPKGNNTPSDLCDI